MQDGEVFIKMHRRQPIRGFFEFYYKTEEYKKYSQFVNSEREKSIENCRYDALWMHPEQWNDDDEEDDDLF